MLLAMLSSGIGLALCRQIMEGHGGAISLHNRADARGCEAQPLIVPGVTLDDGTVHDIVFIATMANQVFAFDVTSGVQLWNVTDLAVQFVLKRLGVY